MYKFDVLAVDNDGNSSYSVAESQYRYPTPDYFKRLLKLGRNGWVVNFTLHGSDREFEDEFSQMMDGGLFNGRTA